MTAPTTPTPEASAQEPAPPTPPWGDNFDPARAWHTIQQLREIEKERDQLKPLVKTPEEQQALREHAALVQASKSDAQRLTEETEAARKEAETARSDALRYQIAFEHGIGKDDLTMLGSGSQEELTARAQWIADKNAAALAAQAPAQTVSAPRRPVEQMRPGATPNGTEDNSVEARHAKYFGRPATQ